MNLLKKYSAILLILAPVITFFGFFFRYTVNAPVNDDYPAVLQFLDQFVSTPHYKEKLRLLFAQHNEHRIVYSRIWTLISFKLQQQVNFTVLSFIGDLALAGIAFIFLRKFLRLKKSLLLFIPVTVLLFNLASWENMTFAMSALSNFGVHLFILASLSFLALTPTVSKRNTILGIGFFMLAILTLGGGLVLFPVSIFMLLYKKEYKHLLLYFFVSLLVLLLYFHGYTRPGQSGDWMNVLWNLKARSILFYFAFLGNAFNYFLVFTNDVQESIGITSLIGFVFFLLFLHITRQKYYRRNLFNYSLMLLIVLTALLTTVSRSSMGLEVAGASRYRINGIIFVISIYFWFLDTYSPESKKALAVVLFLSGCYFLLINLPHYEYLSVRKEQTYLEILCTKTGAPSIVYPNNPETATQRKLIDWSQQLHLYYLPGDASVDTYIPYAQKQTGTIDPDNSGLEMTKSIHGINKAGNDYLVDGFAFLEGKATDNQKVFIGLKGQTDSTPVFFTAKQIPRFDLNPYFNKYNPDSGLKGMMKAVNLRDGGFRARIRANELSAGEHSLWIRVVAGDQVKTIETDSKLIK